jgi:hypothetical protein
MLILIKILSEGLDIFLDMALWRLVIVTDVLRGVCYLYLNSSWTIAKLKMEVASSFEMKQFTN